MLKEFPLTAFGEESARAKSFLVLTMEGTCGDRRLRVSDDWMFNKFRDVDLADPKIDVALSAGSREGTFCATLSATHPAFYVWANVWNIRGEFDDNSFLLLPGSPRTITFTPKDRGVTFEQFKEAFSLRHL